MSTSHPHAQGLAWCRGHRKHSVCTSRRNGCASCGPQCGWCPHLKAAARGLRLLEQETDCSAFRFQLGFIYLFGCHVPVLPWAECVLSLLRGRESCWLPSTGHKGPVLLIAHLPPAAPHLPCHSATAHLCLNEPPQHYLGTSKILGTYMKCQTKFAPGKEKDSSFPTFP